MEFQLPQIPATGLALKRTDTDTTKIVKIPKTIAELNLCYATGHSKMIMDPIEAEAEVRRKDILHPSFNKIFTSVVTDGVAGSWYTKFGKELASQLKLDETGTIVLWPQPTNDPNDPQTWSPKKKLMHLLILTMASFVWKPPSPYLICGADS